MLRADQFIELSAQHQIPEPVFALQRDGAEIVGLHHLKKDTDMIAPAAAVMWTSEWATIVQFVQMNNSVAGVVLMNAIMAVHEIPLGGI
jgi:hypothetical protein